MQNTSPQFRSYVLTYPCYRVCFVLFDLAVYSWTLQQRQGLETFRSIHRLRTLEFGYSI
jgi:hypothetical protein